MINKCQKHPQYKGIKPPKCQCKECVQVYMTAQGLENVLTIGAALSNILFNYSQGNDKTEVNKESKIGMKEWVRKWDDTVSTFRDNLH